MFTWINAYSVGIEEIDKYNKTLIDFLNKVAKGQESLLDSNEKLSKTVAEIKSFAILHFSTERRYMEKYKFPTIDDHIKEHDFFLEKIKLIERRLKNAQTNVPLDILLILKEWFVKHITKTDQQFYTFMKKEAPDELKMFGV